MIKFRYVLLLMLITPVIVAAGAPSVLMAPVWLLVIAYMARFAWVMLHALGRVAPKMRGLGLSR